MYTRKAYATREAPRRGQSDDQPEAREGQAGRFGVAEGFVVPLKLGNAGGGKEPQFKTDAIRGEGPGRLGPGSVRSMGECALVPAMFIRSASAYGSPANGGTPQDRSRQAPAGRRGAR